MSVIANRLTAAQEILLAANELAANGHDEFSEWELTVSAWVRNKNRFGLRGFEDRHPDHKRVMMEIMGQTKKDNPVRRKFFEKTRTNRYRITDLGKAVAATLGNKSSGEEATVRSPGPIYAAIETYIESRPFRAWLDDPDEPRSWLGASAFLGLTKNTANELNDRVRAVDTAVRQALAWCEAANRESITRGPNGGSRPIPITEIRKVSEFVAALRSRFARQFGAIQAKE
jgi:hypothetical protein